MCKEKRPNQLDKQEIYLIEEYKSAVELTFQMDSLRNKLTSFFISFAGIAITAFVIIIKGNDSDIGISNLDQIISTLLILVSLIGHLIIFVLARIRCVQLEHFVIINNIRTYFINGNETLKTVIQLSNNTLPKARFFSGTYFWQLTIQIINAFILGIGIIIISKSIEYIYSGTGLIIFLGTIILSLCIQHILYFRFANAYRTAS